MKVEKSEELGSNVAKRSPRQKMIEQESHERILNFNEVALGYTIEMAKLEAKRCLECAEPKCIIGCPINIDIPGFIKYIKENNFSDAYKHLKEYNNFPAICGRVCPQEIHCEKLCILGKNGKPIAIGALERFIADWESENQIMEYPNCMSPNSVKVAIIGSGPAGLTCATELARKGYDITIFEALHAGGGVLMYGIPEFRLPKEILKNEINFLRSLNIKIKYNHLIGKILTIDELRDRGFKAFFIGIGAGLPTMLNIPGINLNGVLTANEFLTRVNLMKAYKFPEYDTPVKIGKIIIVIGGGNSALDSARVALRLGAEKVIIVYRRSEAEMPARKEEYHHAIDEGIKFQFLTNPIKIIGDDNGNVKQIEVLKMKLRESDKSGRRKPIPIKNSEFLIKTDNVILAIGTRANPMLVKTISELKLNKKGYIETDELGRTNIEDIFAGGDITTGTAKVISAMSAGRKTAKTIDKFLKF